MVRVSQIAQKHVFIHVINLIRQVFYISNSNITKTVCPIPPHLRYILNYQHPPPGASSLQPSSDETETEATFGSAKTVRRVRKYWIADLVSKARWTRRTSMARETRLVSGNGVNKAQIGEDHGAY